MATTISIDSVAAALKLIGVEGVAVSVTLAPDCVALIVTLWALPADTVIVAAVGAVVELLGVAVMVNELPFLATLHHVCDETTSHDAWFVLTSIEKLSVAAALNATAVEGEIISVGSEVGLFFSHEKSASIHSIQVNKGKVFFMILLVFC